jgi:hypothetical protein
MIKEHDFGSKLFIYLWCLLNSPKANYEISTSKETNITSEYTQKEKQHKTTCVT